jgi:hypothetical protein
VLRIIIEYSSLRDFAPYKLGEMIHPNLVVSHSSFDILLSLPPPQTCTQPQVTLPPIHNPQCETIFLQTWLWHPSYPKIHVILSKCDIVIENIQIHMSRRVFFLFLVWKFAQMWIINMKRDYLIFFLERKKSLYLKKIENHVATFHYWFWFGHNFLNV